MNTLKTLYRPSLALLTDLYQLTMAYGYWKSGMNRKEAVFHLFYRNNPFQGGFGVACGLATAVEFLQGLRFESEDRAYLAGLTGPGGKPLFEKAFLDFLEGMPFKVDLDAIPEGTVVFPHEPLLRIQGPIVACQILETPLLNFINFQTLIATKAARVCLAAKGDAVLEFGLRRAQGIDGALTASRAAYIGGCHATSNLLAGKLFGIPVQGTHAHSWVLCFDDEREAFAAYARAMPDNCVFLVDTYNTLEGVTKAVEVGRWLRQQGHEMIGIRLDSGDLASLGLEARRILDDGGFPQAKIIASGDLDEHRIASLKERNAPITVWGVGTRLVTGHDQPALGGVYKLSAVREPGGPWQHKVKLSEEIGKGSNPGLQQVRRYHSDQQFLADLIYDVERGVRPGGMMTDPTDPGKRRPLPAGAACTDLLEPVLRGGQAVEALPSTEQARGRTREQLGHLPAGVLSLQSPQTYPVGLEDGLQQLKADLICHCAARG